MYHISKDGENLCTCDIYPFPHRVNSCLKKFTERHNQEKEMAKKDLEEHRKNMNEKFKKPLISSDKDSEE
jgi:hypothetical protein